MWGMMSGPSAIALLVYAINPDRQKWKDGISIFNAITSAVRAPDRRGSKSRRRLSDRGPQMRYRDV